MRANGGVLKTKTTVTGLAQQADTWVINVGGEPLSADVVVNAAGAWANHIATLAGARTLPLTPMRRTAAIAPAPENSEAWPLVHTISADLYFKPESPGLMICPQDETPSEAMDALPDDLDVAIGIDRFHRITDHGVERVLRSWAGLRTFSADRFPTVGFVEDVSGYFWLAGQGGFGVQTSPGLGRHAADIILGREPVRAQIDAQRFLN